MNKVWYIKRKYGSGKLYKTEKAFLAAVRREDDPREVIVYEMVDSGIAGEMAKSTLMKRDRENQLKIVLGESSKYEEAISAFKKAFEETAPESESKEVVLREMSLIGLDKKNFSKLATSYKTYLLFGVSDTVEWYQTLLKCHNFVTIPNTYYKRGKGTAARLPTDPKTLENFALAKESLKKKKSVKP